MKKLSDNEIKRTLKSLPDKRYVYMLEKAIKNQFVVFLEKEENAFASSMLDEEKLIPIWPSIEFAEKDRNGDWEAYTPKIVTMDKLEPILDFIEKEKWKLDVFPVGGKTGVVVDVEGFIQDLNDYHQMNS